MNNETIVAKRVKCFLRNTMVVEGIVEEWSDARVVLSSLDGKSLMIIHKPTDDILMTKVILGEETSEIPAKEPSRYPPEAREEIRESVIKQKLQETLDADPDLQKKSVAELRDMVLEQERQIIANKTKEHFGTVGAVKLTHYGTLYAPKGLPKTMAPGDEPPSAYKPRRIPKDKID